MEKLFDEYKRFLPVGAILPYGGNEPPEGWLMCDGTNVSRLGYSRLFAVFGTTFGQGDGETTFSLPDFRGRSPMGDGQGPELSLRTLGQTLGEETHTLSVQEMPAHTHDDKGHAHEPQMKQFVEANLWNWEVGFSVYGVPYHRGGKLPVGASAVNTTATRLAVADIQPSGGGEAHNVISPMLVVSFVCKY